MKTILIIIILLFVGFNSIFAQELILSKPNVASFPNIESTFIIRTYDNKIVDNNVIDDFILKENSKIINKELISIDCFTNKAPFELLMIVDISASMGDIVEDDEKIEWVRQSMRSFINKLDMGKFSSVAITTFCTRSEIIQNFTNNKSKLISAINNISAVQASTNINVAFLSKNTGGIDLLKERADINRIIVFLTDGQHDASHHGVLQTNKILNLLKVNHIKLFAITFMDYSNNNLVNLANKSGGAYYLVKDPETLSGIYNTINEGVNGEQYCIIKWKSELYCNSTPRYTKVDLQYKPLNLYASDNYIPPEWSVFNVEFDKELYYFGNIPPDDSNTLSIEFSPNPWDYDISQIYLDNLDYFQIVDYGFGFGIQAPDKFIIKAGESHTIKVKFTQKNNYNTRNTKLNIDAAPCDESITLYGGKGAIKIDTPIKNSIHSLCETIGITWSGVSKDTKTELYYKYINDNNWKTITKEAINLLYSWTPPLIEGDCQIKAIAKLNTGNGDISEAMSDTFQITFPKLKIVKNTIDLPDVLLGYNNISKFSTIAVNSGSVAIEEITHSLAGSHAGDFSVQSIMPNKVYPNDSIDIEILFEPKYVGKRQAILYLKPDCGNEVKINLNGKGLCSLVPIDTIDFGVQYVGTYKDSIVVKCLFNPMNISADFEMSISGPNKNFSVNAYKEQVFTIEPHSNHNVTVYFNPDDEDIHRAFLNFNIHGCSKVKTLLLGKGKYRGIKTDPLYFSRKLHKSKFDTLSLSIKNLDMIDKNILSIELLNNQDIFTILDLDSSNILLGNKSIYRRVVYTPNKIATDTAYIKIIDDFGDTLTTYVSGATYLPQIKLETFCPSQFSDIGEGFALLNIINIGDEPVKIDTCLLLTDSNEYFWQDKVPQDTIVTIIDTLEYIIIYKPETTKTHLAEIILWANNFDADYDSTFIDNRADFDCESIEYNYTEVEFGNNLICESQISSFEIKNLSENLTMKVFFNDIIKQGIDRDAFEILNVKDTVLIKGGATVNFSIKFTALHLGQHSAEFIIPTSENKDITQIMTAFGDEISQKIIPKIKIYKQKEMIKAIYSIQTPNIIDNISKLNVNINYNIDDLFLNKDKIKSLISSDIQEESYLIIDTLNDTFGSISFRANGKLLPNKKYDILEMEFMGLFSEIDSTSIIGEILYPCHTKEEELAVWKADYFCMKELRNIFSNGMDFEFFNVIPNPTTGKINLKFQVPYNLTMKISIYSLSGTEVKILFEQAIDAGKYDMDFDISDLGGGAYFISYEYGKNRKVFKFIKSD